MSSKLNETTGYKVAGLTADLMNKLRNDVISIEELEKFLTMPSSERNTKFGVQKIESILSLISGTEVLKLDPVDGNQTIRTSKNVFSYIDDDFKNYGADQTGSATKESIIEVYEIVKDATLARMFGSLGQELDKLCLTQHQILNFISKHRNWLRTEGYATLFLFKSNDQFFVADVDFNDDGSLEVDVFRLGYSSVWGARYRSRVVVPQLTA